MRHRSNGNGRWAAAVVTAGLVVAGAGCGQDTPATPEDPFQAELDLARSATARYQDVSIALQEGFVADAFCVSSPAGTMGYHYVNPARVDGRLTPGEPEMLLYVREGGRMRLVAIEYLMPVMENGRPYFGTAPPANPGPAPQLFGHTFEGPMPGHIPTQPWHFDLHVWLWQDNPAGRFAQFNPSLTCS